MISFIAEIIFYVVVGWFLADLNRRIRRLEAKAKPKADRSTFDAEEMLRVNQDISATFIGLRRQLTDGGFSPEIAEAIIRRVIQKGPS